MNNANRADSHHVRKSRLRIGLLADARFTAQLARDLGYLSGAGRTNRMAHRKQSAGCAYCASSTDIEFARRDRARGLTRRAQAHRLGVQQFFDRERVVQFHQIEIAWLDAGFAICLIDRLASQLGIEIFRVAIHLLSFRDRRDDFNRAIAIDPEFCDRIVGRNDHRRRAFADGAALQACQRP